MSVFLVTGATTPLGATLVDALLSHANTDGVVAVGREGEHFDDGDHRLQYVPLDLTRDRARRDLFFGICRERRVDVIVHAASHRDAHDRGEKVHTLNVDVTRELLLLAEAETAIRRFVYLSHGEMYRMTTSQPTLIGEDHPLDLRPTAPQRVRDRVEADLTVCTHMGMSRLEIAVLRCAEIFAPAQGSQLWDFVGAKVCFRPLGFDPMLNILSLEDAAHALELAAHSSVSGVFNIPGADTLPLARLITKCGRSDVPVPGPLLGPLYRARRILRRTQFRYDLNAQRFHLGGILDGERARATLGYTPSHPIQWDALDRRQEHAWPKPQRIAAGR